MNNFQSFNPEEKQCWKAGEENLKTRRALDTGPLNLYLNNTGILALEVCFPVAIIVFRLPPTRVFHGLFFKPSED